MRRFLQRALDKIEKMDRSQIRKLVSDIAGENELLEMVMESSRHILQVIRIL